MTSLSPAFFYLILAVVLIGTELLVMQFSVFWFLFFGLGALVTALTCWVMPELSWTMATGLFLVLSVVFALVFYPMLRKWQNKPSPIAGNDAIGQRVTVTKSITVQKNGKATWSGTEWPAQLYENETDIEQGETAIIKRLEGIHLIVGRKD